MSDEPLIRRVCVCGWEAPRKVQLLGVMLLPTADPKNVRLAFTCPRCGAVGEMTLKPDPESARLTREVMQDMVEQLGEACPRCGLLPGACTCLPEHPKPQLWLVPNDDDPENAA